MKITFHQIFYFIAIVSLISFEGCTTLKEVAFNNPVDTNTKHISIQTKQTFHIDDLGVYASNEFDSARLNNFLKENDSTALVVLNPENEPINNSAYYAFKTWSKIPKTFYFKFKYPEGYKHRYIPKLRINNNWSIIDSMNVFKNDSIVTIKLNLSATPIIVAAQEIQSSADVRNWYTNIVKGKETFVKIKSVGSSKLGRNLPVLDIYKGSKKNKDIIVLLTRQHPPEVTGYYAFQSFLATILNENELAEAFLNKFRILAFPIANPDGVDLGHWRHNAGGVDLNRDWSVYNQPEIKQIVKYIDKAVSKKAKLILGLDFHSTWYDVFYTNKTRNGTSIPNFEKNWFTALEKNIPNYTVNEQSSNSNKPVSKGWFLYGHNAVGITYEIGDATPKDSIELIGRITAEQMMNIILNK